MSVNALKTKRLDLINQRSDLLEQATKCFDEGGELKAYHDKMDEVAKINKQIEETDALIAECEKAYETGSYTPTDAVKRAELTGEALVTNIRKSPQYAAAWLKAIKKGITPDSDNAGAPEFKPLMEAENAIKALTIGGGTTPGEDGGFLVPVDFDLAVMEFEKDALDLSRYTSVETVYTNSGWRNLDTTGTVHAMPKISEMGLISPDQQPSFGRIPYVVEKYADILPISNELMADAQGLVRYLAGWWAPLFVATKNKLILDELQQLTLKPFTGATDAAQVKELKKILNTGLNTAYSRRASLLTNQSGFDAMDNWVDANGRGMLQPDLKDATLSRFKGRPVLYYDDEQLPAETVGGQDYNPLYVGDLKAFGRLFIRQGMRLKSTDVGGGAFEYDCIKIRGTCRMDYRTVNDKAMVRAGFKA